MIDYENSDGAVWQLLKELTQKKGISEILINGPRKVFVEREGQLIQLNFKLKDTDIFQFCHDLSQINRRPFDRTHPVLDGNLPDGSRVNLIGPPYVQGSPCISIRRYLPEFHDFDDRPQIFGLGTRWVDFLKSLVRSRCNILITGGTGVGKTTFLNLLIQEIDFSQRLITIEDTLELSLKAPNVVRLLALPSFEGPPLTMGSLLKNALRMRPDRLIVGEVRGPEAFDLLQAMNTGHEGSFSSLHANSPRDAFGRLENLFLMAGLEIPIQVVRQQISSAIDFVIHLERMRKGERVVSHIVELTGMEGDRILSQQIAMREEGVLLSTGVTPQRMDRLKEQGQLSQDFFS